MGCHPYEVSPQWDVTSVGCHLYGMSLLWDVTPVECHCQPRCHPEHRCHPGCGLIPGGMSPWSRMAPQLKTSLRLRTLTWMGTSPQWDVPDGDTVPGRTLLYSMGLSPQCPTLHGDITPEGLTTLLHRAVTLHGDVTPLPPPPWGHHSAMCHHLHGAVSLFGDQHPRESSITPKQPTPTPHGAITNQPSDHLNNPPSNQPTTPPSD